MQHPLPFPKLIIDRILMYPDYIISTNHLNRTLFYLFHSPESANSDSINVEEGDLIIVGTDGLFDNMNEETLLSSISILQVCLPPVSVI